jgi:hypothetical protein
MLGRVGPKLRSWWRFLRIVAQFCVDSTFRRQTVSWGKSSSKCVECAPSPGTQEYCTEHEAELDRIAEEVMWLDTGEDDGAE